MTIQYHPQKIKPLAKIVAGICRANPYAMENHDFLWVCLLSEIPQLKNKKKCVNCGANMAEYEYEFDFHDAILIKRMGDEFRRKLNEGYSFTEANQVHIQGLDNLSYTAKSRTTKVSKLGLIAKLKKSGKHDRRKGWVITRRGFAALRGESVPRSVTVWRGKIEERDTKKITLNEIFKGHTKRVENLLIRKKTPKADYRDLFKDYDANEWVNIAGYHEGALI